MRKIDLTGKQFSRLTVISNAPSKNKRTMWNCVCSCGNKTVVDGALLRAGHTRSCGCLHKEQLGNRCRTHGMSDTSEFKIWHDMIKRCTKTYKQGYKHYGGRGITVCQSWLDSFQRFIDDMGNRPTPEHTIERMDNDREYSVCNCYWGTILEQANNRRSNIFIEHDGKRMTIAQWAKHIGVPYTTLHSRLTRYNWPVERALS